MYVVLQPAFSHPCVLKNRLHLTFVSTSFLNCCMVFHGMAPWSLIVPLSMDIRLFPFFAAISNGSLPQAGPCLWS